MADNRKGAPEYREPILSSKKTSLRKSAGNRVRSSVKHPDPVYRKISKETEG